MSEEQIRKLVIDIAEKQKEFYKDVDGLTYYWPSINNTGRLSSAQLIILADELDKRNEKCSKEIDKDSQTLEA